jgi:large subunit ribosomal protein L22
MSKGMVSAKLNYLRMSPRKARLVADLLKKKSAVAALAQLDNMTKEAARPLAKLLRSAIANAKHNFSMNEDTLKIKQVIVNDGPVLRRWMPRAMGRATPIRKRSAHIELVLEGEMPEKIKK